VTKISAPDRVLNDTYDGLLRLVGAVESPGNAYAYAYDNAGNRTSVQVNLGATTVYTYNAANEITNTGWQYDAAGNLTNDGTASYIYDALNRMTGRGSTTYTYNGDGVFAKQVASGVTTLYTQDLASPLSQVLQVKVGTAAATNYLYGAARLASLSGTTRTWYAADGLGSVRRTLSDTGLPNAPVNYDPWGTPETGSVPTFGFTGELQDASTGLVNLRARWYSTAHSTFTSFRWQTRIQAIATPQISSFSAQKVFTAPLWPAQSPCSTDTSPLDVGLPAVSSHHETHLRASRSSPIASIRISTRTATRFC
jgi:YD repeat-containing protein